MERLLRTLIDPARAGMVFPIAIVAFYGVWPLFREAQPTPGARDAFALLPWICAGWVAIGSLPFVTQTPEPLPDRRARVFVYGVFAAFAVFAAITLATAPSVPLLQALRGASVEQIALSREEFLKARTGAGAVLPYLNAMLTSSLVPYALAIALLGRYRVAWFALAVFFAYSLVFMEKAFFLRLLLPMMALVVVVDARMPKLWWMLAAAVGLLTANIAMSGFGSEGIGRFLLYRMLEVPPATVIDSLDYWELAHGSRWLDGATSTLIASVLGLERVPFERDVFVYQFGDFETGTASSNAAFFVEAYVNFGWTGVMAASVALGVVVGHVGRSRDAALRCTLPLLLYTVFLGGLLGALFGGGLLILLAMAAWINAGPSRNPAMPGDIPQVLPAIRSP
jgi:hypothetical protein